MKQRQRIALLLAGLLFAGCEFVLGLDDLEAKCTREGDCPDGEACVDGSCEPKGPPDTSGVCMSSHKWDEGVLDGCVDFNCCDSFNPCVADEACRACMADANAPGCASNTTFQAFFTCFWGSCTPTACGGAVSLTSPSLNKCVTESCCAEFTPCEQDPACNACILDPVPNCNANPLYLAYASCRDSACPDDICGSGIVYNESYYNDTQDKIYPWMRCANDNCCEPLLRCADPSMDGRNEDGSDPEVAACLACVKAEAGCPGGEVQAAALEFQACFNDNTCGG